MCIVFLNIIYSIFKKLIFFIIIVFDNYLLKFSTIMSSDQLSKYRKEQQFLYNFKQKYSKLIELNDDKRKKWNFTNFFRKRLFYDTINKIDVDVDGIFRFRCYAYETTDDFCSKFRTILEIYNDQMHSVNLEDDSEIKSILKSTLESEKDHQINLLITTLNLVHQPVIFDMRLYESCSDKPINIDGKIYYLGTGEQNRLKNSFNKVNMTTLSGEKFVQMIKHSRALCKYYEKIKK